MSRRGLPGGEEGGGEGGSRLSLGDYGGANLEKCSRCPQVADRTGLRREGTVGGHGGVTEFLRGSALRGNHCRVTAAVAAETALV